MTSTAYGLELQARALCPLHHSLNTSEERHRFLVGTSSFSAENKIHLLEFHDEAKTLECTSVWSHKDEVLGMWCSPSLSGRSLIATASSSTLRIWQIPDRFMDEPKELHNWKRKTHQVLWDLEGLQHEIRIVEGNKLATLSLEGGKLGTETNSYTASCEKIEHAALDPHHASLCLLACGKDGLQIADYRAKRISNIDGGRDLHGFDGVMSADFSPSKPNKILTCGTDGTVIVHDVRMSAKNYSLVEGDRLKAHEHAVRRACFNPFHDELILTGSADQSVKLWDASKDQSPVCVKMLADFGDSVEELCWSSNGPWVFAGLSYNGKVFVDNVPNEKKISILLEDKK